MVCIFGSENKVTVVEWFLNYLAKFPLVCLLVLTKMNTIYNEHLRRSWTPSRTGWWKGGTNSKSFHFLAPGPKQITSIIWASISSGCMFIPGKGCDGNDFLSSWHGYSEPHFCLVNWFLRRRSLGSNWASKKFWTCRVYIVEGLPLTTS